MKEQLEIMCKKITSHIEKLNGELKKTYNGKKAIIPNGKHAGRIGIIKSIHYYDGYIICLLPPINKKNKDTVLWDSAARSYIDFSEIEEHIVK